jgi:hypothetical protein
MAFCCAMPAMHSCGRGYRLDIYPDEPLLPGVWTRTLNSQIAEQVNNKLEQIKTQVSGIRCGSVGNWWLDMAACLCCWCGDLVSYVGAHACVGVEGGGC